jgi:hypothetical protein
MAVTAHAFAHDDKSRDAFRDLDVLVVEVETGTVNLIAAADTTTTTVTTSRHWAYKAPHSQQRQDANRLTISSQCPTVEHVAAFGVCQVDYQIAVPAGVRVQVITSSGTITGTDLDTSHINAHSSAGDVNLSFATPPEAVSAHTSAGDVAVSVPYGRYRVQADTSAGDVSIDVVDDPRAPKIIDAGTSAGDVTVSPR